MYDNWFDSSLDVVRYFAENRERLVGEGMIAPEDMNLVQVIEEPEAVVEAIFAFYEGRGFQPTLAERQKMLNL